MELDTIICGDNVTVLRDWPAECVDLVVTSPPYDNLRKYGGHTWDFPGVAAELTRVLKPGGVIVWVVADATVNGSETLTSMRQAIHFHDVCGLNVHDTMIYQKENTGGARGSNLGYWQAWEYMLILSKGNPRATNLIEDRRNVRAGQSYIGGGRRNSDGTTEACFRMKAEQFGRRTNIWKFSTADLGCDHPAPFPEALARDHILSWSNPGDVVLDPFAGSCTTCKMAKLMGRRWIAIEICEAYCEIGRNRLRQEVFEFSE